jgi:hypothetical protein
MDLIKLAKDPDSAILNIIEKVDALDLEQMNNKKDVFGRKKIQ